MEFKTLALIGKSFSIDYHSDEEVIRLDWQATEEGFYYFKQKYLSPTLLGAQSAYDDELRVRSLWYANLKTSEVHEILPYGNFDIEDFRVSSKSYYYFLKNDYSAGMQVCRIDSETKTVEFCVRVDEDFHGFELVTDQYIMYRSEDKIPDVSELVIVDLKNKKITALAMTRNDTDQYEFLFVIDSEQHIQQLILNRWVPKNEKTTPKDSIICCNWSEVEPLFMWNELY